MIVVKKTQVKDVVWIGMDVGEAKALLASLEAVRGYSWFILRFQEVYKRLREAL